MQSAAFRFGLVAVFIILIGPVSAAEKHRNKQHAADPGHAGEQQQAAPEQARVAPLTWQTPWPAFVAEEQSTAPGDHQNASEKPKNREDPGDLTVELTKRSTIAAEIQAHYAWRQFQIGIGAAIVSVLAAAFTGWAAWAAAYAARAARAAAEATKIQAEAATAGLDIERRPYLLISYERRPKLCSPGTDDEHTVFEYSISNFGKAPAIITRRMAESCVTYSADFMPRYAEENNHLFFEKIIGAGNSVIIRHRLTGIFRDKDSESGEEMERRDIWFDQKLDDLLGRPRPFLRTNFPYKVAVRVVVGYRGPFTHGHETSGGWVYNESIGLFVESGEKDNYEK